MFMRAIGEERRGEEANKGDDEKEGERRLRVERDSRRLLRFIIMLLREWERS